MLLHRRVTLVLGAFALAGVVAAEDEDPPATVDKRQAVDAVEWTATANKQPVLEVESRRGIGSLTLRRVGDQWPKGLRLRLRLRGLEQLRIVAPDTGEWRGAYPSTRDGAVRISFSKQVGREGNPVKDAKDPWHGQIRAYDAKGKPVEGLPPEGGYFEIVLPAGFHLANPDELEIRWVDFWR